MASVLHTVRITNVGKTEYVSEKLTHYKAIISKRGSNFVLLSELFLATKHVFHKVQSLQRIKCETGLT